MDCIIHNLKAQGEELSPQMDLCVNYSLAGSRGRDTSC
jgi:hypothetical protein